MPFNFCLQFRRQNGIYLAERYDKNSPFLVPKLQFGNAYVQAQLGVGVVETSSRA